MRAHLKIKNRYVEVNLDDEISSVEISYIQTLIDDEITKSEKENPDTLKALSSLLAKYCILYYISNKKLKTLTESITARVDDLIKVARDESVDNSLF